MSPQTALRTVKIVHTVVWAFFAGCIFAIPVSAWRGRFTIAAVLIGIVFIEVGIIAANGWRCPLTNVAARYTEERQENFDIYLPLWLARYNKHIFGTIFLAGILYTLARWLGWVRSISGSESSRPTTSSAGLGRNEHECNEFTAAGIAAQEGSGSSEAGRRLDQSIRDACDC
ncbi:MAG TPA: hypothetical protein VLU25_21910 [Acidobacteriota bacterium]|nr:hypothetical protein [Acidobacteriota bacterium]